MANWVLTLLLLGAGWCSSPLFAATFVKKLEKKKSVVLQMDDEEAKACCKRGMKVTISREEEEIGTFKAIALNRKKKRLVVRVKEKMDEFKDGETYTIELVGNTPKEEEETEEAPVKESGKVENNSQVAAIEGESANQRSLKKFWAAAGGGFVVGSATGFNVEGSYLFDHKMQVGLAYMAGSIDIGTLSDSQFRAELDASASMIVAKFRFFPGNSFNLAGLLGSRLIDTNIVIKSRTSTDQLDISTSSQSIVIGLTLGNHWAFDSGLTIGCDWIGYYVPISSSSSSSASSIGTISAAQEEFAEDAKDLSEKLGKTASDQLLVFTLGWLF